MSLLRPPDGPDVTYEFFAPFVHVPGRYEWCRVQSPTHGVFDLFIRLGATTRAPATVYVHEDAGEAFMRQRYPESTTNRVTRGRLRIQERRSGRVVEGRLAATEGPIRSARMRFAADPDAVPRQVPYGGTGAPVWGSRRWTCWGVDLVLDARVEGRVAYANGRTDHFMNRPALLTLGSFGRIAPLRARPRVGLRVGAARQTGRLPRPSIAH